MHTLKQLTEYVCWMLCPLDTKCWSIPFPFTNGATPLPLNVGVPFDGHSVTVGTREGGLKICGAGLGLNESPNGSTIAPVLVPLLECKEANASSSGIEGMLRSWLNPCSRFCNSDSRSRRSATATPSSIRHPFSVDSRWKFLKFDFHLLFSNKIKF